MNCWIEKKIDQFNLFDTANSEESSNEKDIDRNKPFPSPILGDMTTASNSNNNLATANLNNAVNSHSSSISNNANITNTQSYSFAAIDFSGWFY